LDLSFRGVLWVQSWSHPLLDQLFRGITLLGGEEFFLLLIPLIFWCVDKRTGARMGVLYLGSVFVNEALKVFFHHPRPFESGIRILVESPGAFGFPSGHAQGVTVAWGYLAWRFRSWWVRATAVAVVILVAVSRVYLGVHYPLDVLGGIGVGLALLILFISLAPRLEEIMARQPWEARLALAAIPPVLLAVAVPQPNVVAAMGALAGLGTGFVLEARWVNFQPDAVRRQPWRIILAAMLAAVIYVGLKALLPAGDGFRFARYAIIGLWGGFIGPWALFRVHDASAGQRGRRMWRSSA